MKIKEINITQSPLNHFDLLGSNEVGLSKAFAFVLGKEPKVLYKFLHEIGVKVKNTPNNFKMTSIEIEKSRKEGRTDIEIRQVGKFHVIVESKIGNSKVSKQRTQYLNSFDPIEKEDKVLCFITGVNDFNKEIIENIEIHNLSWLDIGEMLECKEFVEIQVIEEFLSFIKKGYNMRNQKEILVQDLSHEIEIERYREHQVYRRDVVFGSPLYFAPYFTRDSNQPEGEGIAFLSKVLGILTLNPKDIENYSDELTRFSEEEELMEKWKEGVMVDQEDQAFTYFFLDVPLKLDNPLKKDGGIKKGRGKGWIAAKIPKNRCVSFQEFTKRLIEAKC